MLNQMNIWDELNIPVTHASSTGSHYNVLW